MKTRIIAILLLSLVGIIACTKEKDPVIPKVKPGVETKTIYETITDNQIIFILATQSESGAFKDTKDAGSRIMPYFANIACRALLKKPSAENIAAVKKWMVWYMSKLNGSINPVTGTPEIPGSVYDYFGVTETTKGTYDSADSYAATFLSLAKELGLLSPADLAWLKQYSSQLMLIGGALEKCIDNSTNNIPTAFGPDDNDGLSIDSYVHGAKYLMDNSEVNEGLKSMIWLQSNGVISNSASHLQELLDANTAAFESQLWRETMYNWYDNGTTGLTNSKWSVFYADAASQLYPCMYGVIDVKSDRANIMYRDFNIQCPNWADGVVYDAGGYPWAVICYAAAVLNDKPRVDAYINHILTFNKAGNQKPKWYIAEAAFTILAANKILNPGTTPRYFPLPIVPVTTSLNLALGKAAKSSGGGNTETLSNDGDLTTRWFSAVADNQWWEVDLGSTKSISRVDIKWEAAYATDYEILVSNDDVNFTKVFSTASGVGGNVSHPFTSTNARYVKILLNKRIESLWAFSFWEFEVYK